MFLFIQSLSIQAALLPSLQAQYRMEQVSSIGITGAKAKFTIHLPTHLLSFSTKLQDLVSYIFYYQFSFFIKCFNKILLFTQRNLNLFIMKINLHIHVKQNYTTSTEKFLLINVNYYKGILIFQQFLSQVILIYHLQQV